MGPRFRGDDGMWVCSWLHAGYALARRRRQEVPSPISQIANQNGTTMPSSGASQLTRLTRLEAMKMPPSASTRR
jgi:hypothetical protein